MYLLYLCLFLAGCATPPPQPALNISPRMSPAMSAPVSLAALRDAEHDAESFSPWMGWLVVGGFGLWIGSMVWREWRKKAWL